MDREKYKARIFLFYLRQFRIISVQLLVDYDKKSSTYMYNNSKTLWAIAISVGLFLLRGIFKIHHLNRNFFVTLQIMWQACALNLWY